MKLRRFTLDGYKALDDLTVEMPSDLLFLIGMNGAGKSSILQGLTFIRAFAEGNVSQFFADRQWLQGDVRPRIKMRSLQSGGRNLRIIPAKNFDVRILLERDDGVKVVWEFVWAYTQSQLISEAVWIVRKGEAPRQLASYTKSSRTSSDSAGDTVRIEDLRFAGSVFAYLSANILTENREDALIVDDVISWASGITSLELLSPVAMRRTTRGHPKDIGPRGERLAGFISAMSNSAKARLIERVKRFYPIIGLETIRKTAGWIDMRIGEAYPNTSKFGPAHMSDGFLRILALCSIPDFDEEVSLVLLDEVEDGIEPHVLPNLIEFISEQSSAQLILTSHSPLLVNFFTPDKVRFLTRREDGSTALASPSDMKMFSDSAEYLGLGEIWAAASSKTLSDQVIRGDGESDELPEDISAVERIALFAAD